MSYLAQLLAVYRAREAQEASEGYVFADTFFRVREIAQTLIVEGCGHPA